MNSSKKDTKQKKKTNLKKPVSKDKKGIKNTYKFKFHYNENKNKNIDDIVMIPVIDDLSLNLFGGNEDIIKSEIIVNNVLYIGLFN